MVPFLKVFRLTTAIVIIFIGGVIAGIVGAIAVECFSSKIGRKKEKGKCKVEEEERKVKNETDSTGQNSGIYSCPIGQGIDATRI